MKIKDLFIFCIFFLSPVFSITAQTPDKNGSIFVFEGLVYGYEHDASRKLFKKNKQTILEGILEGVSVNVYINDKLLSKTQSNSKGEFRFILKIGGVYKVELSKEGYDGNIVFIDTKGIPAGSASKFIGAEFILNSFKIKNNINEPVGTLYYNQELGYIDFKLNENRSKKTGLLNKKNEQENLVELMKRAVIKNKKKNNVITLPKAGSKAETKQDEVSNTGKISGNVFSEFQLLSNKGIKSIINSNLSKLTEDIRKAREQLEDDKLNAVTEEDFLLIRHREAIINAAETELQAAIVLIHIQKSKIKLQSKALYLSISSLIILLVLLAVIFIHYKEKARMHRLLYRKNKKILDSINYAERIQKSILVREQEIQKYLPESFIFYCPKDIVSGDFYWFSEINGKLIFAIIDCTGHGVPGAFMSLIGNTLLNQIVNEKNILDPASILHHLHIGVLKALQQEKEDSWSEDGMEMALCVVDQKNRTMEYAGAMNPLYLINNTNLEIISADTCSIGGKKLRPGKENTVCFKTQTIQLSKNTSVYMFTDGYMDQFGGEKNKKFNTANFKKLLLGMQELSMEEQKLAIHVNMANWKGNYPQIDDMLVAGFKV